MNDFIFTGTFERCYEHYSDYHDDYEPFIEIMVDDMPFEIKIWHNLRSAIEDKPKGTMIAVKGKIMKNMKYKGDYPNDYLQMYLLAEKISFIERAD